jgi:hypothetical protein
VTRQLSAPTAGAGGPELHPAAPLPAKDATFMDKHGSWINMAANPLNSFDIEK